MFCCRLDHTCDLTLSLAVVGPVLVTCRRFVSSGVKTRFSGTGLPTLAIETHLNGTGVDGFSVVHLHG